MSEALVVDASPLILLARCQCLDLLPALSRRVLVPWTVWVEVQAGSHHDQAASAVELTAGIQVVTDVPVPGTVLLWGLDAGESQVLAYGLTGYEVVLDDRAGRRCAKAHGVMTVGTAGIVLRAKRKALIPFARPVIEALQAEGMFFSEEMMNAALAEVGE